MSIKSTLASRAIREASPEHGTFVVETDAERFRGSMGREITW